MSIKQKLLSILEKHGNDFISGSFIAEELNISRTMVWKTVNSLRQEGYNISASSNKGYCLKSGSDVLSEAGIYAHIKTEGIFKVKVCKKITSTKKALPTACVRFWR